MLPGVGIAAEDFAKQGLVGAVHERGIAVDVIAVRPELDLYFDGSVEKAIHREIVEPARNAGYSRFWFLAISLGGMSTLLYASAHPNDLDGLILIAPFLATQGTFREITEAGGLASWSSDGSSATPIERQVLAWLKDYVTHRRARPALYLGYGMADRFSSGHTMLSSALPKEHVVTVEGGHDWETWGALWRRLLDAEAFLWNKIPES